MPTVTSIKPQKNQKRVNIYLDDKFGFGLDLENFVKLGLKVGQELTEKQIEEIVKKAEFQKVYDKILRLEFLDDKKFTVWWIGQRLQFKSKSKKELVQELRIKGIDKEIIDAVLAESKIDEVAMAKKLLKKRKYMWEKLSDFESRKKMSEFLLRKGFNWEVIREVIKGIDADSFDV